MTRAARMALLLIGCATCAVTNSGAQGAAPQVPERKTADRTQEAGPQVHEFDRVDYLFGPVARQTGDHVSGEVARGKLVFDGSGRILYFLPDKGPNLRIPYEAIDEFAMDDKSLMRSGAVLAAGVMVGPFIRQHKHFLTILYFDVQGASRRALLQLDKGNYRKIENVAAEISDGKGAASAPGGAPNEGSHQSFLKELALTSRKLPGGEDYAAYLQRAGELTPKEMPALQGRADSGDPRAQLLLGMALALPGCKHCGARAAAAQSATLVRRSAVQGFATAQFALGQMLTDAGGSMEGRLEACNWFEKAAKQNDPWGFFGVGECYLIGDVLKENRDEGMRLLRLAAEEGVVPAQITMGMAYLTSGSDQKTRIEGYMWLELARQGGVEETGELLKDEPAEFRDEVARRAAEWNKRFSERLAAATVTKPTDRP